MEGGHLARWLVADGAQVTEGMPIYTLEMEKSVQDVESPVAGTIRILVPADAYYEVGTLIAQIQ
jgi:pyruvate/2-oxoglutarate dehydrogenase complex dihydrolipoamide acyltransferase (E2) component